MGNSKDKFQLLVKLKTRIQELEKHLKDETASPAQLEAIRAQINEIIKSLDDSIE